MEGSLDDQAATTQGREAAARDLLVLLSPSKARAPKEPSEPRPASASPPAIAPKRRTQSLIRLGGRLFKLLFTACVLSVAALAALLVWDYYVAAPWTRDGRVRVQVASVAPQVSGQITEVRVVDNQFVRKGDVLYVIDRFDFQNALDQAKTQVTMKAADLQVKSVQAERRQHLTDLATTAEEQQQYVGNATQAEAAFKSAQASQAMAEINLGRTRVTSPVNGFITNFQMRVGDYAHAGTADLSIIDADSYWVDGYFEETKMAQVCVGDRAEAQLMGYARPILGVVDSVTRGIAVSDAAASTQGLPNVDPVYTWVRLAQRVPVRIRITDVPPGVPLVSGMTATVSVRDAVPDAPGPWWRRRLDRLEERVAALFAPPEPRAGCVPPLGPQPGRVVTLSTPEPAPARTPAEINPGLTPSMTRSPKVP
jgi:RND family efflux transporter MFP subunit